MIRVERIPVKPDVRTVAALLDQPLCAVVTVFAERLQLTGPELVDIAVVRLDVIADCRQRD
jgi:hypothetical protein